MKAASFGAVNRAAAGAAGASSGGKTVMITGVSKGLGRALALELAKRGHTIIGCSRAQDKLNSLQSELSSDHNNHHLLVIADVVFPPILHFLDQFFYLSFIILVFNCLISMAGDC